MSIDLVSAIYKQMIKSKKLADRESHKELSYIFHAHEAGDCTKRIYLRHTNTKPAKDDRKLEQVGALQLLFSDGRRHQESISTILKQCPNIQVTNEEEGRFIEHEGFLISGHPDLVIHDTKKKARIVIEVKGLNHFYCLKLRNEEIETLKEVYPTAIPQARIYSIMYDTDYAIAVVKNKNTSELYQFTIPRNAEAEQRILARFARVHTAIVSGSAPNCDYLKGDKKCKWCPYPQYCGRDDGN